MAIGNISDSIALQLSLPSPFFSVKMSSDELDKKALLDALHAHGQAFMSSFAGYQASLDSPNKKKRKVEPEEDEWTGFPSSDEEAAGSQEDEESQYGDSDVDNSEEEYSMSRS